MKSKHLFIYDLILSVSCTTSKKDNDSFSNVIDIERGMQNITKLKASDFGKTIRYIPLETTDDCLIGSDPIIKVLKNHIVVEANNSCLLFDKKDGRFISAVGHRGQDPEAFSSNSSWTDEKEEFLYFIRQPANLIKYDMKGNYAGKIEFSVPSGLSSYYLISDSEIVGYNNGINNSGKFTLVFFDKEGVLRDSIPLLLTKLEETMADILSISVTKGSDIYGIWAKAGAITIDYKNDKRQVIAAEAATLWRNNENIRFKENFIDTIYNISDEKLIPAISFNTGKWRWPEKERTSKKNNSERIFISFVSENNAFIFFQFITGLYSDESVLYNGLYDKKTGETKLAKNNDELQDDLTGFMPFKPIAISTSGEFASLIEASDIMEWAEKHPETKSNSKLNFLKELNEDANPVIVLIE